MLRISKRTTEGNGLGGAGGGTYRCKHGRSGHLIPTPTFAARENLERIRDVTARFGPPCPPPPMLRNLRMFQGKNGFPRFGGSVPFPHSFTGTLTFSIFGGGEVGVQICR